MKRLTLLLFAVLFPIVGYIVGYSSAQQQVDRKGTASTVKLEQVMSGYLTALNGKYKLTVTETTFEPGGYVGEHHHVGPGIRYVASGELTLVQQGKTITHKTGDYFYESGDITTAASNKTNSPVRVDWPFQFAVSRRPSRAGLYRGAVPSGVSLDHLQAYLLPRSRHHSFSFSPPCPMLKSMNPAIT